MRFLPLVLVLLAPVSIHAESQPGITPEAVKAFKEIAAKADNEHWKRQEERLDKSAKLVKAHTKEWMDAAAKSDPKATQQNIEDDEARMKKWEEENFGSSD